jgi:putative ABC transport system substrate-binding protein
MRRREFLTVLAGAAAWPFAGHAQQPAKVKRLAMMHPAAKSTDMRIGGDPTYTIIFEELRRLGYVEGVNLVVDRYSAEGRFDRYPEIARDVVATRPDVIYALSNLLVLALKSETRTIPIVAWVGDPVAAGIVSSLARPGGNVTGVSTDAGAEMGAKRLELLAEAVGKLTNVRVLAPPPSWEDPQTKAIRVAAEKMNIPLRLEPLRPPINEATYRRAFDAMQRDHVDGVWINPTAENYTYRVVLGRLAQEYRIPAISVYGDTAEAGALMAYAIDPKAGNPHIAAQIVEILDGGSPAEMPVFQVSHWELVINLKAAKELGLKIPAGLVARADKVIE